MGLLDGAAGLLFKIEADASGFEKEASKIDASVGNLSNRMSSFAGIATIAGAGILAVTSAAVTGSIALFRLAQAASEYGSEIFDATEKTGLAAETISSLKVAADQSGTSLDSVTSGLAKFAKTIGEANDGSDQAQAKLKKIGVTSLDLDTALSQALATIAKYPPGVQQMTAAQAAFGKSGADLLPFIKSFDGNLPGLIAKCKELGLTLSNADARAADEFGDTLDTLSAQLGATGRQFALGFMPAVTQSMAEISTSMIGNQNVAREWGQTLGDVLRGTVKTISDTQSSLSGFFTWLGQRFYSSTEDAKLFGETLKNLILASTIGVGPLSIVYSGADERQAAAQREANVVRVTGEPGTYVNANRGRSINLASSDSKKAAADRKAAEALRKAEELARRDFAAASRGAQNNLDQSSADIGVSIQEMLKKLEEWGTGDNVIDFLIKDFERLKTNIDLDIASLEKIENTKRASNTAEENSLLTQEQALRRLKYQRELEEGRENFKKGVEAFEKERDARRQTNFDNEIRKQGEILAIEKARLDLLNSFPSVPLEVPTLSTEGDNTRQAPGIFDGLRNSWLEFFDLISGTAPTLSSVFTDLGGIMQNAFQGFASAVGSVTQNLIIMGSTGPAVARKMLASVLASISAESAVRAIFETAKGFASLFFNPAEAAAHFQAAALFGSIALGAGIAGRFTAGNLFNGEGAGSASGSGGFGSEPNAGNRPGLQFTERFQGFLTAQQERADAMIAKVTEKTNAALGRVADVLDQFTLTSPQAVLAAGIPGNESRIFDAHVAELEGDGSKSTRVKRAMGDY
jgi:hypothetical protein